MFATDCCRKPDQESPFLFSKQLWKMVSVIKILWCWLFLGSDVLDLLHCLSGENQLTAPYLFYILASSLLLYHAVLKVFKASTTLEVQIQWREVLKFSKIQKQGCKSSLCFPIILDKGFVITFFFSISFSLFQVNFNTSDTQVVVHCLLGCLQ